MIPCSVYLNAGSVKNNVVFAMVFLFLAHKLWKIAYPWLVKYFNEREGGV